MIGWLFVSLALLPNQDRDGALTVGEAIEGEITDDERLVQTEMLQESYAAAPTVGRRFAVAVEESGPYTIELRSYFFDAYLVLRDGDGNVLAEDDDGLLGTHARLVAELEAGATYLIDACALHGERGRFELSLGTGAVSSGALSPLERAAAEREDLERRVRALEETLGPASLEVASSLNSLAKLFLAQGDSSRAQQLFERALAIREAQLGPEDPAVATLLNNLAEAVSDQGGYAEARALHERALAIREAEFGPDDPRVATSLGNLGSLLAVLGDLEGSRALLERALAIREETLGPEHPSTAVILNNLGQRLADLGEASAARRLQERALAIWEKVLGPDHPRTAAGVHNLAALVAEQGDYEGALVLFARALATLERTHGLEHPNVASTLSNMGEVREVQGDLAGARRDLERALEIRKKLLGPDHPDLAGNLNDLAHVSGSQGDERGACGFYERSLAIQEKVWGPKHPSVIPYLRDLGHSFMKLGEFADARRVYERALAVSEEVSGPESADTASALNNLAILLKLQGDYAGARPLYERALAIREEVLGPEDSTTAKTLTSLGTLLMEQGEHSEARDLHRRALAIQERVSGPEDESVAIVLSNLGHLLHEMGDTEGARPHVERAAAIFEKVHGPEHPRTGDGLHNLGEMLRSLGDIASARRSFERALTILEQAYGPDHHDVTLTRTTLAMSLLDSGDPEAAWDVIAGTTRSRSERLRSVLPGLSEGESYRYLAFLRWGLDIFLSAGAALGHTEAAYEGLLDWKGRIARDLMASRERLARALEEDQVALVEELRRKQVQLSSIFSEPVPAGRDERAAYEGRVAALREERSALEREIKRSLEGGSSEPVPTVGGLSAALPQRTAVLDLFVHRLYEPGRLEGGELVRAGGWSDERVFAWIVRAGESDVVRVDLGSAAEMQAVTRDHLRRLVSDGVARGTRLARELDDETRSGKSLADLLWAPLSEHLQGVDLVFVSPDSFLGGLPLETIESKDGRYLVEDVAFSYQQDVALMARPRSEATGRMDSLLAVGAVDFGGRAEWSSPLATAAPGRSNEALARSFDDGWTFLPGTDGESRAVHALHEDTLEEGERMLLQAGAATEERLKHELSRHSVLHLATHGFFHPEGTPSKWESALDERGGGEAWTSAEAEHLVGKHPGLLSGLVCAGANLPPEGEGDDGYLTAEEVGWLDLSDVELVVMSACETGLGRAESGEGLIGLRRAFRTAGAKTVVSSLWSVGDVSTAELMQDFYANLWTKGMGRLEALRSAQLAMLRRNREEHGAALPSTWGAFVLSGEWR